MEVFWDKVDQSSDCWLWTRALDTHGYGVIRVQGKLWRAHRLAWALTHGPIPSSVLLDHKCHTRHCVRPEHLRKATKKQNNENLRGAHVDSKSGVRGVSWSTKRGKWIAQVGDKGRVIYLGGYTSIAEAEAVVIAARERIFTPIN